MWTEPKGVYCHWCGADVRPERYPSTGKHLFCCDGHKMAHARAYAKWLKRCVTDRAARHVGLVAGEIEKSNAKPSAGMRTSSAEISAQPCVKSNAAKSARALKLDRLRTDTRSAGLLNSRKGKSKRISAHL